MENKILSTHQPNSADTYTYIYDPWGRRIWKQDYNSYSATTTCEAYFYGATGQKLESYSCGYNSGNFGAALQGINTYMAGRMLSEKGVLVATDRLGSVRGDSNGVSLSYFPWGEERGQGTTDNRTKFASYHRDAPGQDYAMARYYSATTGSFWGPDPGGMKTADSATPTSWNRYGYAYADPINRTDRSGLYLDAEDCISNPDLCSNCLPGANFWGTPPGCDDGGGGGEGGYESDGGGDSGIDCNALVAKADFAGLTYENASKIWADGNLSSYSTDATAATIAALAPVTWQGESSFIVNPKNNPNKNDNGVVTSVDYGPFQINQMFHPNSNGAVWGSSGGGQVFDGNPDVNIAFGIQIVEGLYNQYGNNAAGRYVGSLGNWTTTTKKHKAGTPINPNAQKREATWNSSGAKLTTLFSNTDCFSHQ